MGRSRGGSRGSRGRRRRRACLLLHFIRHVFFLTFAFFRVFFVLFSFRCFWWHPHFLVPPHPFTPYPVSPAVYGCNKDKSSGTCIVCLGFSLGLGCGIGIVLRVLVNKCCPLIAAPNIFRVLLRGVFAGVPGARVVAGGLGSVGPAKSQTDMQTISYKMHEHETNSIAKNRDTGMRNRWGDGNRGCFAMCSASAPAPPDTPLLQLTVGVTAAL